MKSSGTSQSQSSTNISQLIAFTPNTQWKPLENALDQSLKIYNIELKIRTRILDTYLNPEATPSILWATLNEICVSLTSSHCRLLLARLSY